MMRRARLRPACAGRLFKTTSAKQPLVATSLSMERVDASVPPSVLAVLQNARGVARTEKKTERDADDVSLPLCGVIGSIAGGVGAVIGVGGGVIASPLLRALGMEQKHASATCLPMVLCSAATAAISWHLAAGASGPDVTGGLIIGTVACFFSPIGVKLSLILPGKIVGRALGIVMTSMGILMAAILLIDNAREKKANSESVMITPSRRISLTASNERVAAMVALGAVTGLAGGAFGVGGGVFLVPILSQMTDVQTAAATSLTAILAPTLISTLVVAGKKIIVWRASGMLILSASVASFLSARFAASALSKTEQKSAFSGVMTLLGLRMLLVR